MQEITKDEWRIYEKVRLADAADDCIEMLNQDIENRVQFVAGKDPDKIYDYIEAHMEEIAQNFLDGLLGDDALYLLQREWWYTVLNEAIKEMPTN